MPLTIDTDKFELDDEVEDRITGIRGIIIGFTQWTTGCARAVVQRKVNNEGKVPDATSHDVTVLKMVKEGPRHAVAVAASASGGPAPTPDRGR